MLMTITVEAALRVNLHATYRLAAGEKVIYFQTTMQVDELLRSLCDRFPLLQREFFNPDHSLCRGVHIFINRRDLSYLSSGLSSVVGAGDVVDLFPTISGG
jgi:molybdopterin converting factor small subunit